MFQPLKDEYCDQSATDATAGIWPRVQECTATASAGPVRLECNIGDDRKTVDFFERYTDSKAALFNETESFAPFSKEFFAVAKLTRWVIYGMPSDEFKKANADFHPIYMTPFDGFVS